MPKRLNRIKRHPQAGMTLIEVLLAGIVLTVGLLGFAALIVTAIATNSRNRADSTATMLTQSVIEQVAATTVGSASADIYDCGSHNIASGTPFLINTAVGGAKLDGGEDIDWSESTPPTGYHMDYQICASPGQDTSNYQQRTYDVRWNVQKVGTNGNTYYVVVGARPQNYRADLKHFALPINTRVYVGEAPY